MTDIFGRRSGQAIHDERPAPYEMARVMPKQQAPRRSLWGRALNVGRQLLRPENLQVIGHTLQEIGGQPGRLDDLYSRRAYERQQSAEMDSETRTLKEHQAQQQALEAVIASLTPQQQAMARLNPSGFVENLLRQMQPQEWQAGPGYTHAFRVGADGNTQLGGELPLRPRAPRAGVSDAEPQLGPGDEWVDRIQ